MRTSSSEYRGTLAQEPGGIMHYVSCLPFRSSNADTRFYTKVVGKFTVLNPEGAKYSMEFADDKYNTEDYSLSVSELLSFFNCATFPFKEQTGWMAAAGMFMYSLFSLSFHVVPQLRPAFSRIWD